MCSIGATCGAECRPGCRDGFEREGALAGLGFATVRLAVVGRGRRADVIFVSDETMRSQDDLQLDPRLEKLQPGRFGLEALALDGRDQILDRWNPLILGDLAGIVDVHSAIMAPKRRRVSAVGYRLLVVRPRLTLVISAGPGSRKGRNVMGAPSALLRYAVDGGAHHDIEPASRALQRQILVSHGDCPVDVTLEYTVRMSIPTWARTLYREARKHSSRRGIPFEITAEEFTELVAKSGGRCTLTGIAFEFESAGHRVKRPFAPSLDRLDSQGAYRIGNVRLVCVAVNLALNQWGDSVLMKMAKGLVGALSIEEASFRNRPTAKRMPGVIMRISRRGVAKYHAYAKGADRPEYRGSYDTEFDAFNATKASKESLQERAEISAITNRDPVDRRRKYPKTLIT